MLFSGGIKNTDMSEPACTHTKVLIWAHERGIVRMQDRGGWWFIKIPSPQMNEMLSSGVGHFFNALINRFLAISSASWQPKGGKTSRVILLLLLSNNGPRWVMDVTLRCYRALPL